MAAILLDLFNTLVRVPEPPDISTFLDDQELSKEHPAYDLCCRGLLLAPLIVDSGIEVDTARHALMTNRLRDIEDGAELLECMGKRRIGRKSRDLTDAFRDFFSSAWKLEEKGVEAIRKLSFADHKLIVVTNADSLSLDAVASLGIESWTDGIAASCDVRSTKPDSTIFERAAQLANSLSAECIMIGDSWRADIVGALNFGARTVWLDLNRDPLARFIQRNGPMAVSSLASAQAQSEWRCFISLSLPAREFAPVDPTSSAAFALSHWKEVARRGESLSEIAEVVRIMISGPSC
jgi:HAD superfamily hydrolase (TIGR01549 family)